MAGAGNFTLELGDGLLAGRGRTRLFSIHMRVRRYAAVVFAFLLLYVVPLRAAQATPVTCGDDADEALFRVASWVELAAYWERFPGCDDGYFGERVSELVGTWLARRPTTIARLTRASRNHPGLLPLVLGHIDTISSRETLGRIRENADRRCPGGSEDVCKQILVRLRELNDEAGAYRSRTWRK